jgi:FkbM family methyltransferase
VLEVRGDELGAGALINEKDRQADKLGPSDPTTTLPVVHHQWKSDLILGSNGRVRHGGHGSLGSYYRRLGVLHVVWDDWSPDLFLERDGRFMSVALPATRSLGLREPLTATIGGRQVQVDAVALRLPGSETAVEVRPASSDVDVFGAVFLAREYARPELGDVRTILDLGANTGMASVFYAERHPEARIIAVEPDAGNMLMLRRNVRGRPRVVPVHAAVWHEDTMLRLRTTDASGERLPDWGFQTRVEGAPGDRDVQALSIPTLMRRHGLQSIDLLKVDIEGAEYELFSGASDVWLSLTRCIVVETHERFKPGSDGAVTDRLAHDFEELTPSGENRIFMRRSWTAAQ